MAPRCNQQLCFLHNQFISYADYQSDAVYALWQVNEFLAGAGPDAPDVEEENVTSRLSVSYDDMWAKTLLETSELEVQI